MTHSNPPPEVSYDFAGGVEDDGSPALLAVKRWRDGDAEREQRVTIASYGSAAELDLDSRELHTLLQTDGVEAAMNLAESMAVASGCLHDGREDARLFTEGPPDPFTTHAERERVGEAFIREYGERDTEELPAVLSARAFPLDEGDMAQPAPGSWDELVAQQRAAVEPEPERHYWQMHYRPVETPEGKPLGTALFVTEFPGLPPDFDDHLDEFGMDDTVYPTEARTLEMAHFASEAEAAKFDAEFRGYLVPGLLDGPELAPEVAKLEGLSGEWQSMNDDGIAAYMRGERTIVREVDDWHLHNPNAEREAQAWHECESPDECAPNLDESGPPLEF